MIEPIPSSETTRIGESATRDSASSRPQLQAALSAQLIKRAEEVAEFHVGISGSCGGVPKQDAVAGAYALGAALKRVVSLDTDCGVSFSSVSALRAALMFG